MCFLTCNLVALITTHNMLSPGCNKLHPHGPAYFFVGALQRPIGEMLSSEGGTWDVHGSSEAGLPL